MTRGDEDETSQNEAVTAILRRAVEASCYLAEPSEAIFDLSSGTLLRTSRGQFVVLTAAHCVAEYPKHSEEVRVGLAMAGEPSNGVVVDWHCHPTADVALVVLDRNVPVRLADHAPDSERVGPCLTPPDSRDSALLIGCPAAGVVVNPPELGVNMQQYLCPFGDLRVADDGRWLLKWDEAEFMTAGASEWAPQGWRQRAEAIEVGLRGQRVELPAPHGMSGGGLWQVCYNPDEGSEIWHAGRHLRLVGIQSKYREPDVIIEPASRWNDWFRDTIAALDDEP